MKTLIGRRVWSKTKKEKKQKTKTKKKQKVGPQLNEDTYGKTGLEQRKTEEKDGWT